METIQESAQSLKQAWDNLKESEPQLRIRDAAAKLGVTEAQLLATGIGANVIRLTENFTEQLEEFPKLGRVMSLTRSEGCVLEHKGPFQKIEMHQAGPHKIATVIGPIEQRVFFAGWKFGFAVTTETPRGTMKSLQYFDKAGEAVMKVYLQEKSNGDAYEELVKNNTAADQSAELELEAFPTPEYTSKAKLDFEGFTQDWENMKDTHDFFGMLRKYKLNRQDAVKWIGEKWAYEVDRLAARKIVETAAATKLPIMIFAGNKGNIQIHQGKVQTVRQMGDWLNVLDPDFNMHLNENVVDKAYVVHKNTEDGLVSAVELFDKTGEMVAQFFGLRKPGLPQKPEWKALVDSL
ncbi:putative hemin transport protein [Algoriphagus sp. 4150]|uniref:hemin-degrading factor n=1 Tax=Algoriphagus sp. 4150 TaxID=2817756 RepID=UPI00285A835E|nr:ChuX/HutX family heme-like substrate-binding protein [Algoriphagus sp. 4150]MDR7129922.1 putative hemin transport protein [Algoriphagus sp. 4150]